jgi:hypothetical protein
VRIGAGDALLFGIVFDAVELEDEVDRLLRDRCSRKRLVKVAA